MDRTAAKRLVEEALRESAAAFTPDEVVIVESETMEREWGWVFFYQSRAFLHSNDFADMLAGNAPYIVNRHTGEITITGTAHPVDYYIAEYEKTLQRK